MAKKITPARAKTKTNITVKEKSFPFAGTGLLFIALSLLFAFSPVITRAWGLDYIAFFDGWVIILFYLLLLCFWLPPVNGYIVKTITSISKKQIIPFLGKYRYVVFVLIGIIAGYCFYLLKIKYILLGDFDIRGKEIEDGVTVGSEPLTMFLLHHACLFLNGKFGLTGIQTIRFFDYISGGLFFFIGLCAANLMGNTLLKKLAAFVVSSLSLAALLVFCGYTDVYALPLLFLQTYLFVCLLHLKRKISILLPVLVGLIGVGLHLMLVCMIPSLVFLIYGNVLWKYPFFRDRKTIFILILVSLPFIYFAYTRYALPMIMPLEAGELNLLTLFSTAHYVEFLNSQLLASGAGFLIWITILIYSLVHKIKYDMTLWFFLVSSLSIAGLMFVFNGIRGSGDWDIFSFAAVVYNMGSAYFLLMAHEHKWFKNIKYGILMFGGFSVLHTSLWIVTNKTDASIPRLESAIATDPANYYKTSYNNESLLASAFSANGLHEIAIKWSKQAWLKHPKDPRMGYNYANELIKMNKKNEAVVVLEQTLKSYPAYALPYASLIQYYVDSKNYQSLYRILLQMEQVYKQYPEAFTSRLPQEDINKYFSILSELRQQIKE
jgi:tetratricopeptide (TPR) repeat protein